MLIDLNATAQRVLKILSRWVSVAGMDDAAGLTDEQTLLTQPTSTPDEISITILEAPEQLQDVATVLQQIWGSSHPIIGIELLRAVTHAGGYVAGAFERGQHHDRLIGASVGFLGRHQGQLALHSHITGILAGVRSAGVGRAMKQHQRDWCADNDIDWITWTFDPLVRRNAWFNIEVLGAEIAEYLVDFYGPMDDAINAGDQTDRLVAAWRVEGPRVVEVPEGSIERRVPVPDNIVGLRRTDPSEAERWRLRVRAELGDALQAGAVVTGFTRDGEYVLREPS